jgi:carboxylesterase
VNGLALLLPLAAIALGSAMVAVRRSGQARVRAFMEARQLPLGADGIIAGAQPIALDRSATHAALLLHGFGDTPQSLALLARELADRHGWTVRVPLLPGHGRTLAAFAASDADAWSAAARAAHEALRATHAHVVLVGLSMGGALATIEAARVGERCPVLVLLAPYLTPTAGARRLAGGATLAQLVVPWLAPAADPSASIHDPEALAQNLGYGTSSPRLVRELVRVADRARAAAAVVRAPVTIVHGRSDYRVPATLAATHPSLFVRATACALHWIDDTGHVITVDRQRAQVFAHVVAAVGAAPDRAPVAGTGDDVPQHDTMRDARTARA